MNAKNAAFLPVLLAAAAVMGCSNYKAPTRPAPGPRAAIFLSTGDIAATVADFRTLLGDPANGGTPGPLPAGRREVNWDGAAARPFNNQDHFPIDFFNTTVKSGLVYDGASFRNDSLLFAEINPTYATEFKAFSPKVMFSAIGTNVVNAVFRIPGAATPAAVTGFGAVFSDVDLDQVTSIEPMDKDGRSLGRFFVPRRSDGDGFSFLGVKFDDAIVASVRIVCGNGTLAAGTNDVSAGGTKDLVVVDNFIFGEPAAVAGTTSATR